MVGPFASHGAFQDTGERAALLFGLTVLVAMRMVVVMLDVARHPAARKIAAP